MPSNRQGPSARPSGYRPRQKTRGATAWVAGSVGLVLVALLVFAIARHPVGTGSGAGLPVGAAVATSLSLASTTGSPVSLSAYAGKKVILFFYEGASCGPCQQQLVELQQSLQTIRRDGGEVLAASTDTPAVTTSLAKQLGLGFPILFDTGGRLGSAFGIFGLTGGMNMGAVDRHSVFVINGQGKVSWKRLSLNQMHVPVADILSALRGA